ncbi:hypothetical protein EG68_07698 [Paragonimus skrjabini miyazakii]|uniref:BTB domain-containing protein n=1 Tax=Paragonimus skrjabini miyazakii TaxID=59628 RepID=A0A8S9YFV8_9TREM|nr:hypothetical protein EG68_07698 [Paragonimus skrjabini miyazakii]
MDWKKYRDSGELSDFTVYVGKDRFKLHKFPLYTRSEYFKEIAPNNPVCELTDFPGGSNIFSLVADFCYGKPIQINAANVVYLNAGAETLRMSGKENLRELTKHHLKNLFSGAKLRKQFASIISVLSAASTLKEPLSTKISEDGIQILRSCWLPTEELSVETSGLVDQPTKSSALPVTGRDNQLISDYLAYLPLPIILLFVKEAGFEEPNCSHTYDLINKYLGRLLDSIAGIRTPADAAADNSTSKLKEDKDGQNVTDPKPTVAKRCQQPILIPTNDLKELNIISSNNPILREELKKPIDSFDALFDTIPEENALSEYVNSEWIKQAVLLVENNQTPARCRSKVLQVAHKMLGKLGELELSAFSSATMRDLVSVFDSPTNQVSQVGSLNASRRTSKRMSGIDLPFDANEDNISAARRLSERRGSGVVNSELNEQLPQVEPIKLPEGVTKSMVNYLGKKADEKKLTVTEFFDLLRKLNFKENDTESPDKIMQILKTLQQSDRGLSEQEKAEIIERIDLSKCSPETLSQVLETDLLPPKPVASAAIKVLEQKTQRVTSPEFVYNLQPESSAAEQNANNLKCCKDINTLKTSKKCDCSSYQAYNPPADIWRYPGCTDFSNYPTRRYSPVIPTTLSSSKFQNTRSYPLLCPKDTYKFEPYSRGTNNRAPVSTSYQVDSYRKCPELENTDRLLDIFEEEMRRELAKVPGKAHLRTLCRAQSPFF